MSIRILPSDYFTKKVRFKWFWKLCYLYTQNVKVLVKHGINDKTFQAYEYWEGLCEKEEIPVPYSFYRYWEEHLLDDVGIKTRIHPNDKKKNLLYSSPKGYTWGDLPRNFKSKENWS